MCGERKALVLFSIAIKLTQHHFSEKPIVSLVGGNATLLPANCPCLHGFIDQYLIIICLLFWPAFDDNGN